MIELYKFAQPWREKARVAGRPKATGPGKLTDTYLQQNRSFGDCIIDALRARTKLRLRGDDRMLFVAHTELFLSELAGLVLPEKKGKGGGPLPPEQDYLMNCQTGGAAKNAGIFTGDDLSWCQHVGLGQPVSVADTFALLSSIGYAWRVSRALGRKKIRVLATDPSWMCANRSLFQFVGDGVTEADITNRLILNAQSRRMLYGALGLECNVEPIPRYAYPGSFLSRSALEEIGRYYRGLVETIYGVDLSQPLTPEQIELITRCDPDSARAQLPESVQRLMEAEFLSGEKGMHDLRVLARVVKIFRSVDMEIFIYFFAQWLSQRRERGKELNVAPITELPFHRLFNEQDEHIVAKWGNHGVPHLPGPAPELAALYYPHHNWRWAVLPYNVLSLESVSKRKGATMEQILERLCALDRPLVKEQVEELVRAGLSHPYNLNREFGNLTYYLLLCHERVPDALNEACQAFGFQTPQELFAGLGPQFEQSWLQEADQLRGQDTPDVWGSWLKSLHESDQVYTPPHILFGLCSEWPGDACQALSAIPLVAGRTYQLLTESNYWGTALQNTMLAIPNPPTATGARPDGVSGDEHTH